jgi:glycerophosphoryl diester phosphodiesterase
VHQFTASELKKYGNPTLIEVFDLVNQKCFINIELKGNGTAAPVHNLIEYYISDKQRNINDFLISSYDWKMLEESLVLNPKIRICILAEGSIEEALAFATKIKAFSIHPNFRLLTKENVALMQKNGFVVFPWTVNSKEDIQNIKSYNVNGIISDFPDRI